MAQDREIKIVPENQNQDSSIESVSKLQLKPLGASGTELFSGYFSEEYLQALRGRRGAKIYDEMRRSETQVNMLLNAIMNTIKQGVWEFEAAADVPDAELHREFIEYNAKEKIDWETHLHEALTFLIFGNALFEIVNDVVFDHPKFGTFNGLKALAYRSPKTIERWIVDPETGDLKFVEQYVQGDTAKPGTKVEMNADFLMLLSLSKEGDNYEGISVLRAMYGPWFRKNLYLKIAGIGVEKNAIGTPIGTVPAGNKDASEFAKFKETLENFTAHESAYLIIPEGWKIEVVSNSFDATKIKELILLENTEMINCVVANFLALGMNGGGGAFALGSDLSDFFLTGIQAYANVICGVWNRKLIPNLIKLNYGPQSGYPKLKAAGINDKAGKELAEIFKSLVDSKGIKPDDKTEEYLRKQYSLPKADPTTARNVEPPKPFQFTEKRIKLAESYKKQWSNDKDKLKEVMQSGLNEMLEDLKKQVSRLYKSGTAATRVTLPMQLDPKTSNYKSNLREALAEIANQALVSAKKETPKAKNVKLSERIQLAAPRGGYFDSLPANIRRIVSSQANLIGESQAADLNKIVSFQYASSQSSTDDLDQILLDIDFATQPTIEGSTKKGMSVEVAAGNAVSSTYNQAQLEWFFEPEVLATIESFTFINEDPISEICQELDGTTWAVNDPDLDRYSPPLHHNCKSRLMPNEKGAEGNPEIQNGTPVTQKGLDSITLCEGHYHLNFECVEPKRKN